MHKVYEPFVIRRLAEGRVFYVNPEMPFEYFLDCFQTDLPFFMVAQLPDGRICITPNANVIPQNFLQAGYGPWNLLPTEWEYVTIRGNTYPVIMTAHPVQNVDEWLFRFERFVLGFAKQTLCNFVTTAFDFIPLKIEAKIPAKVTEPVTA